ncbi:PREDICTED: LOB domain-containing protein 22 [Nelumbo nucifera]|uniref:LOB domain-containing protein 22 n=1 Tax=Nelumbo nucifera TaxID=4432 RepID=A0A1U8AIG0_NELNU|nr:PREDICTED: LOB domain-containing protein 22 [Nelumbo nucifera]
MSNVRGGGATACAACRYQRKKCPSDCPLARYFPPDRQGDFHNAHKLFGVGNITKLLKNIYPRQRDDAMRSIIYQANARAKDPVGGCLRIVRRLNQQIDRETMELKLVLRQLAFYRAHAHQQQQYQIPMQETASLFHHLHHGTLINPDPINTYNPFHHLDRQQPQHQPLHIDDQLQLRQDSLVADNQQFHGGLNQWTTIQDPRSMVMQDPGGSSRLETEVLSPLSSSLNVKNQPQLLNESGDIIKPLLGIFDERESLPYDSKEPTAQSGKGVKLSINKIDNWFSWNSTAAITNQN